jgi:hypothetical protein
MDMPRIRICMLCLLRIRSDRENWFQLAKMARVHANIYIHPELHMSSPPPMGVAENSHLLFGRICYDETTSDIINK